MSAAKTGTPAREKPSASTCSVTVLPVPVAPVTSPCRLASASVRNSGLSLLPTKIVVPSSGTACRHGSGGRCRLRRGLPLLQSISPLLIPSAAELSHCRRPDGAVNRAAGLSKPATARWQRGLRRTRRAGPAMLLELDLPRAEGSRRLRRYRALSLLRRRSRPVPRQPATAPDAAIKHPGRQAERDRRVIAGVGAARRTCGCRPPPRTSSDGMRPRPGLRLRRPAPAFRRARPAAGRRCRHRRACIAQRARSRNLANAAECPLCPCDGAQSTRPRFSPATTTTRAALKLTGKPLLNATTNHDLCRLIIRRRILRRRR